MTVEAPSYGWRGQDEWTAEEELDYQLSKIDNEGFDYYLIHYTDHWSPREEIQEAFEQARDYIQDARQIVHDSLQKFADENSLEYPSWGWTA